MQTITFYLPSSSSSYLPPPTSRANAICYSVNEGDGPGDLSIAAGRCYCLFIADDFASSYGAPIRWRRVNFRA